MASVTSLSNSSYNTSSIYGNRNVLSGLASGMDTESMIENAVSGIKMKIQNLIKKRTKVEWQQEAYRSIIDKAATFNTKYTSYSSKTNLLSQSFFSNAVNTAVNGTYKDKITASGKTNSDIKINAVKQMASAATYTISGVNTPFTGAGSITGDKFDIGADIPVSTVSGSLTFQYGGTNGATFDIKFDELEDLNKVEVFDAEGNKVDKPSDTEKLAQAIQNKLKDITYNYTKNGFQETTTADKAIKVKVDGMNISFEDGLGNGNKVSISNVSGNIEETLGIGKGDQKISLTYDTELTKKDQETSEYLEGKELGITFNGATKKISMDEVLKGAVRDEAGKITNEAFVDSLNKQLGKAFGTGKITASHDGAKLSFSAGDGDSLSLGGSAIEALGFENGDSNFVNTGKKLSELISDTDKERIFSEANRVKGQFFDKDGNAIEDMTKLDMSKYEKTSPNGSKYYIDDKGNRVDKDGYRIDNDGKALYDFQVNDAHINVTEDTTLESLVNSINSNPDAGVKVGYSKLTNEFKFTATETGSNSKIEFGGLADSIFKDPAGSKVKLSAQSKLSDVLGSNFEKGQFTVKIGDGTLSVGRDENSDVSGTVYWLNQKIGENDALKEKGVKASFDYDKNTFVFKDKNGEELDFEYGPGMAQNFANAVKDKYVTGQDAIMDVEINGKRFENLTRSGNSFDLDGLTVNVKGTFEAKPKNGESEYEAITFNTTTDSDKIVDTIREFVNDYNEMITEIKSAYSTMPAQNNNGARYEPLTAEQEEQYSESELAAYNEKAKQGILFGDSTLSSMYGKMLNAIQPGGADGQTLREIGIGTSYENGLTTLSLDEDKLRSALESDPDKVKTAFTKTREGGASSDGLMQTMQNTLNTYVKTTGEPKGVLITRAGSVKAPTSLNSNSLKSQIDSYDNQIERWQNKMADQIDRYTTQFSRLEQLIAEMNSQASAMSGLMGGSSGY